MPTQVKILNKGSAYLLGFAKKKLKQLSDIRTQTNNKILQKKIQVRNHKVYLSSAEWGDSITLSGEQFKPDIVYGTYKENYIGSQVEYTIYFAASNYDDNEYAEISKTITIPLLYEGETWNYPRYDLGLVVRVIDGKVEYCIVYWIIQAPGFPYLAGYRTARIKQDKVVLSELFPLNTNEYPGYTYDFGDIPFSTTSIDVYGTTYLVGIYSQFCIFTYATNRKVYDKNGKDLGLIVKIPFAVLQYGESVTDEIKSTKFIPGTRLTSFGGVLPGDTDQFWTDWSNATVSWSYKIADLRDLERYSLMFIAEFSSDYAYGIVHGGQYDSYALDQTQYQRRFYDIYKISRKTGDIQIFGTYNMNYTTGTLWNRAAVVYNLTTDPDFFGYSIMSADDIAYLFFTMDGNPSSVTGVSIDVGALTGTRRPIDNNINNAHLFEYVGDGTYYLSTTSVSSEYKSLLAKVVVNYDSLVPENTTTSVTPVAVSGSGYLFERIGGLSADKKFYTVVIRDIETDEVMNATIDLLTGELRTTQRIPDNYNVGLYYWDSTTSVPDYLKI